MYAFVLNFYIKTTAFGPRPTRLLPLCVLSSGPPLPEAAAWPWMSAAAACADDTRKPRPV